MSEGKRKAYRVPIHWFDRVFNDQLEAYTDYADEYEGKNEKKGWKEYKEDFSARKQVPQLEFRWFEYIGKTVDPNRPAPLILVLDEYYNTIWQHIADREGLYLLASEYHRPGLYAPGTTEYGTREEEIDVYMELIERFCAAHLVDRKRIYYYGLSYGDMTGYMFVRKYKNLFGAAVFMNGPIRGQGLLQFPLSGDSALPVLQLRADCD